MKDTTAHDSAAPPLRPGSPRAGSPVTMLLAGTLVAVAAVGLLDAVFTDEHDFVVLFAMLAGLGLGQVAVLGRRPTAMAVRRDVARWLHERARLTGEPVDRIADRAVWAYRSALADEPDGAAGERHGR